MKVLYKQPEKCIECPFYRYKKDPYAPDEVAHHVGCRDLGVESYWYYFSSVVDERRIMFNNYCEL